MATVNEQIKALQEIRVQEILNDNSISKIKKLKLLAEENLWPTASYIQHEFKKWEFEAIELERLEAERIKKENPVKWAKAREWAEVAIENWRVTKPEGDVLIDEYISKRKEGYEGNISDFLTSKGIKQK